MYNKTGRQLLNKNPHIETLLGNFLKSAIDNNQSPECARLQLFSCKP